MLYGHVTELESWLFPLYVNRHVQYVLVDTLTPTLAAE